MNILTQNFVFEALASERDGSQFPINFDLVWAELGYSRRDNARRRLVKSLIENVDFALLITTASDSGGFLIANPPNNNLFKNLLNGITRTLPRSQRSPVWMQLLGPKLKFKISIPS